MGNKNILGCVSITDSLRRRKQSTAIRTHLWFNSFSEENCHITCEVTAHEANISSLRFCPYILIERSDIPVACILILHDNVWPQKAATTVGWMGRAFPLLIWF
jgi:hypothetical protein